MLSRVIGGGQMIKEHVHTFNLLVHVHSLRPKMIVLPPRISCPKMFVLQTFWDKKNFRKQDNHFGT